LLACCSVPLQIMHCCCKAIDIYEQLLAKNIPGTVADIGTGVCLCQATLLSASFYVSANTKAMRNYAVALRLNAESTLMLDTHFKKSGAILDQIRHTI